MLCLYPNRDETNKERRVNSGVNYWKISVIKEWKCKNKKKVTMDSTEKGHNYNNVMIVLKFRRKIHFMVSLS